MRKIRFAFFYLVKLFKRYKLSIFSLLIMVILGLFLLINLSSRMVVPRITEGVIGTYTEADTPALVTHLLSQSLVTIDKVGKPQPNLVESWQSNNEATLYTFKLKKNLVWSDGSKIVSADLNLSIPDVEISYPDPTTIQFKLTDSYSPFPTLLTKPILKKDSLIGTGPYVIDGVEKTSVFLKKITLKPLNKSLPELSIRFYPSETIAKDALEIGEVQAIVGLNDIEDIKDSAFSTSSKVNPMRLVTIFYNTKDPILSDDNFRLALSFAAPSTKGEEEAITSIQKNSWAFNGAVKDYLDNTEQAKVYFNKVRNGRDSTIALTTTASLRKVGERVVEAWNGLGIKAVLRVESGIPQNFQALLISQNIPSDPDQYSLWHSTQVQTNIAKYSSPRIDKDLEDGRKAIDLEVRRAKYQDFQKVLLDHSPATFLYFPRFNVVYLKKIDSKIQPVLNLQLAEYN